MENQPRYTPAKKEANYSKMWCHQFPTVRKSTHKALGTISSVKSDIRQIIQKSARAEFGRMHIGGIAMLFNKYLLRPYSVGSTVQCMHFCKLGFHLHWASWCLGPPSATSQRKDFGGRVSGFQSLLWHVLAKQLLSNPQCPYL